MSSCVILKVGLVDFRLHIYGISPKGLDSSQDHTCDDNPSIAVTGLADDCIHTDSDNGACLMAPC